MGNPPLIHEVPDYLIGELPVYRKELQQSLETEYEAYCNALNEDLARQLDQLIDEHKAEIKNLLENASDRDTIRKTLPDFDKVINEALKNNVEGQTLKEHIDEVAAALKEAEKRMDLSGQRQRFDPGGAQGASGSGLVVKSHSGHRPNARRRFRTGDGACDDGCDEAAFRPRDEAKAPEITFAPDQEPRG